MARGHCTVRPLPPPHRSGSVSAAIAALSRAVEHQQHNKRGSQDPGAARVQGGALANTGKRQQLSPDGTKMPSKALLGFPLCLLLDRALIWPQPVIPATCTPRLSAPTRTSLSQKPQPPIQPAMASSVTDALLQLRAKAQLSAISLRERKAAALSQLLQQQQQAGMAQGAGHTPSGEQARPKHSGRQRSNAAACKRRWLLLGAWPLLATRPAAYPQPISPSLLSHPTGLQGHAARRRASRTSSRA